MGYNRQFDWLMRHVHCDAFIHCGTIDNPEDMSSGLSMVALPFSFCVPPPPPPPLHLCFLAKNINKTTELLKHKIFQKARRNRPKEQNNFTYSSTCQNSKINRLGIRRISFCLDMFCLWAKACNCKIAEKKLEKDTGIQKT